MPHPTGTPVGASSQAAAEEEWPQGGEGPQTPTSSPPRGGTTTGSAAGNQQRDGAGLGRGGRSSRRSPARGPSTRTRPATPRRDRQKIDGVEAARQLLEDSYDNEYAVEACIAELASGPVSWQAFLKHFHVRMSSSQASIWQRMNQFAHGATWRKALRPVPRAASREPSVGAAERRQS